MHVRLIGLCACVRMNNSLNNKPQQPEKAESKSDTRASETCSYESFFSHFHSFQTLSCAFGCFESRRRLEKVGEG